MNVILIIITGSRAWQGFRLHHLDIWCCPDCQQESRTSRKAWQRNIRKIVLCLGLFFGILLLRHCRQAMQAPQARAAALRRMTNAGMNIC